MFKVRNVFNLHPFTQTFVAQFVIFSVCTFAVAQAAGYGGRSAGRAAASSGGGYGGSGGGAAAAAAASGYGGSYASGGGSGYSGGVIPAAIQTRHNIEFREVPSTGSIQPATIEVGASSIPLNILFRSASSSLNVLQHHQGAAGDTQESESEGECNVHFDVIILINNICFR